MFCGPSAVFTNVENPRAEADAKSELCGTTVAARRWRELAIRVA